MFYAGGAFKDAEYKLAQSGDATCNGLESAEVCNFDLPFISLDFYAFSGPFLYLSKCKMHVKAFIKLLTSFWTVITIIICKRDICLILRGPHLRQGIYE